MKSLYLVGLFLLLSLSSYSQSGSLQFVYKTDGTVDVYPDSLVTETYTVDEAFCVKLISDSVVIYEPYEIDSVSLVEPVQPAFTSFKFNNKYNEELPENVFCEISGNMITGTLGTIGKYLTPSFQTSEEAEVSVNGIVQESKVSRNRYADDVIYTVSNGKCRMLTRTLIVPEEEEKPVEPENDSLQIIPLTIDMISTNAPSGRGEDVDRMLDDDVSTYFHSTWSNDPLYEKLPSDSFPYIQVVLDESLISMQFYYLLNSFERAPFAWRIWASNDGEQWDEIRELTAEDGVPQYGESYEYYSPTLNFEEPYSMFRFEATQFYYKNYIKIAEFKLYEVLPLDEDTTEIIETPKDTIHYVYSMVPYGVDYTVRLEWLTDYQNVPRIDIDIDGGATVTSKDYYLRAKITVDGGDAFEDFTDSVSIKGRGNTTWSGNKRPYRLKFDEKVKLFGLRSGKNWVLLANAQDPTLMDHALGFKTGQLVGAAYSNHPVPVDLYMNGKYYGSYTFTEKLGISNNSVDIDDLSPFFELDTYYDEPYKFRSSTYNMPVMIHNPELDEDFPDATAQEIQAMFDEIRADYNHMEELVATGDSASIVEVINVDSLVRFMLVNDLTLNLELMHPKSTYLFKPYDSKQYYFGPIWDLDWGYGYEIGGYFNVYEYPVIYPIFGTTGSYRFYFQLFSQDVVKRAYYRLWREFVNNYLQEVIDYVDDYSNYSHNSLAKNMASGFGTSSYPSYIEKMKIWLQKRATYVYENLTPYEDEPIVIPEDSTIVNPGDSTIVNPGDSTIVNPGDSTIVNPGDSTIVEPGDSVVSQIQSLPANNEIKITLVNGTLSIESPRKMMLPVYDASGKQIALIQVQEGHNLYLLVPKGVFIINRQKIHIR